MQTSGKKENSMIIQLYEGMRAEISGIGRK